MLCRNCNNNLSGEEDFCPHCGIPQKLTDVSIPPNKNTTEEKDTPKQESSIFQNEPVYIYTDPPKEHKKSKAPFVFISVFIITLLIIGTVTVAEYFQLTPAFSSLFQSHSTTEAETENLTVSEEFDSSLGTIAPDVNFKSTLCTVSSEKGLTLRKGPDNSYAAIDYIPFGTALQIIGKSLQNDLWGYVYIPSLDLYGWLLCSYLTEYSKINEEDTTTKADENETTDKHKDKSETKPESTSLYRATVTAEKGLYLRVGPGTDYEAIYVAARGETVTVLDVCKDDNSWLYVSIDDKTGYMNKTYLSEQSI